MNVCRILLVDDNEVDREQIRRLLTTEYSIDEAPTAQEGLRKAREHGADCVLLDYRLPDRDGIDVLRDMVGLDLPVLMLTGRGNEDIAVEAMKLGAFDYLNKSKLERDGLRRCISGAVHKCALQRRIAEQQAELRAYVAQLDRQRNQLETANRALAGREEQLRVVIEQLPGLVWTVDSDLRLLSIAGAGLASLGLAQVPIGRELGALGELGAVHARDAHREALGGTPASYTIAVRDRSYECHVEALRSHGDAVDGVIGIALDVTETRILEHQFRHAQKMDALGKLAGGVAHDFNNLLTAITAFAGFVQDALPPDSQPHQDIQEVLAGADRATALVRQLLAFSRREPVEPRVLAVDDVMRSMTPMLERVIGENIELRVEIEDQPWRTRMDPGFLEQVVVNLVVNARDAMPGGGRLRIAVDNQTVVAGRAAKHGLMPEPGDYVRVRVIDQGVGIAPDVVDRIFDPFFSTRGPGGTGLGLSTCYGIVEQVGGGLCCDTEVGRGTAFHVYLPRSDAAIAPVHASPRSSMGGTETILVVEDEEAVRAVVVRTLKRAGYTVIEASSGAAAMELAREHPGDVHALLTDVVMPDLRGSMVAHAVRAIRPDIKVVFMTGYSDGDLRAGAMPSGSHVIEKPFSPEALARRLRDVLDGN